MAPIPLIRIAADQFRLGRQLLERRDALADHLVGLIGVGSVPDVASESEQQRALVPLRVRATLTYGIGPLGRRWFIAVPASAGPACRDAYAG